MGIFGNSKKEVSKQPARVFDDSWSGCHMGLGIYPFREQLESIAGYLSNQDDFSTVRTRFSTESRGVEFYTKNGDVIAIVQIPDESGIPHSIIVISNLSEKSKALFTLLQWLDFIEYKPLPIYFKEFSV